MTGDNIASAMPGIALALLGEPVRALSTATEWRYGRRGSLSIDIARGLWRDHEAGTGGGVIALIQRQRGGDMAAALRWLGDGPIFVPNSAGRPVADRPKLTNDHDRVRAALAIWDGALSPERSPVATYLKGRGLRLSLLGMMPADRIRFAPACPFGPGNRRPAMLAMLSDLMSGETVGIRRTALTPKGERACDDEGRKLPHKVLGRARGAVARLAGGTAPPAVLGLCEGVESGLSVMAMTGATVWACPAGLLSKVPVLHGVERLTIYADNDPPGLAAAREAASRWRVAGRQCGIETPSHEGADFNDLFKDTQHD
ncbi:toprim domain-containing protein [Sandarakinorhabdus sp.]|uniref:DUF7146 domain-containing protein n=1 Tax=Sandarakinorhabdus sp. TaxID=1916663 RepID=UPI00286E083D|nr:toprim domain-containing protein [Sandarakinorhabdus sp.]